MSIDYEPDRRRYRVRWREHGRQRSRRFLSRRDAEAFAASLQPAPEPPPVPPPAEPDGSGVYAYATTAGPRWRLLYRQSDGTLTTRRGFASRAAAVAARATAVEAVRRGQLKVVSRATFAECWSTFLALKRPYVTAGTLQDYDTHGRKRLLPWFGELPIVSVDEDRVRDWLEEMLELVADGELSPKTVNNARTCLSMTLGEAVRRGQLADNACRHVPGLPEERRELDYLRLDEIERYLEACGDFYRPLAEFLIGTGARISEALAVRWPDTELETGVVRIARQRARTTPTTVATKGKRFRSVQIGPRLVATLQQLRDERAGTRRDDGGWVFLCPPPLRGRYSRRTEPVPPNRRTAHDWHEWALEDAGLRDMPLHALRHTAATAWLATGHPLIFVQRQLGHRSITTTEEHYGHLESSFVRSAAAQTEALIASAAPGVTRRRAA
jgi:integrase